MSKSHSRFSIEVEGTENRCPIGDVLAPLRYVRLT
jgi:hypothetical protein